MPPYTPASAIALIQPNSRIFVQGGAATPNKLLQELVAQRARLKETTLIHLHTEGPADYAMPGHREYFRVINIFVGKNLRRAVDYDRIDYLPCPLSQVPGLFRSRACPLDVALLHVSPPDAFGYCSLGVSVDVALAAAQSAPLLIAQVNPKMPRIHGDALLHRSFFTAMVSVDEPLPEIKNPLPGEVEAAIAQNIAPLIEDGATLQMGIGTIPDAVTYQLLGHKNLGLHSEMWSDGALNLIKKNVINNSQKQVHAGKSVSSFLMGSRELYEFVNDNPSVIQLGMDYVNNPSIIARNPKVVAINSAVEIDLTGQVCADSIGSHIISGVGGQIDFMRGAALSPGGKSIIAMHSKTASGESKLVASLRSGAGVVSTRAEVHYVATEFGVASLYGKTIGERARALIKIAHPSYQEKIEREFFESHRAR